MIRLARKDELGEIAEVYADARRFMAANGNPSQWGVTGYPQIGLLKEDIELERLYVIERRGKIAAAFVLFFGEEPTYRVIREGAWPSGRPYLTVHRLGSLSSEHGTAKECLDTARETAKGKGLDVRADTHEDNKPVRHILEKYGFEYCGRITVADGTERLAYQLKV